MRIPFLSSRKSRGRRSMENVWLKPETKRAIMGVILLLLAVIAALGMFNRAGPVGRGLFVGLRLLFGWLGFVMPLVLVGLGVLLIRPFEGSWPRLRWVGILLLMVGLQGALHLIGIGQEETLQVALEGSGGGVIGFALSFPLQQALGRIASVLLFITATLVGVFLTFNVSLADVMQWFKTFMPRRGQAEDNEQVEEAAGEGGSSLPSFRISSMRLKKAEPDPDQLRLEDQEREQKQRMRQQVRAANRRYQPPSLELLHMSVGQPDSGNVEENRRVIKDTLDHFGIQVTMGKESIGPTVTQYTLRPDEGVKLSRITALQNDLALALAAHPIRIEAPIPGTNFVGIEIPNKRVSQVRLHDLIGAKMFRNAESPLTISMGKDVAGKVVVDTLERMPHLLVAGATGSGKSIFINTIILALLYRNSPALVRFILVDPKRVELSVYNDIPHLLTPVIIEAEKTVNALRWAVREMDRRYRVLSESGARNLLSFNTNNPDEAMPMIVIIIDELADLMAKHARDVEGAIVRLSQMARAVGIHLVLATQRPSVNVITGLIKANIPSRVAFNVASQVDSRTILDRSGAEKLLGRGDMLFLPGDRARPVRIQGGYISEEEVRHVVEDLKKKNPALEDAPSRYDDRVTRREAEADVTLEEGGDDKLLQQAKQLVVESGKASASLLQRRLRVGYARAARLLDILEEKGVIGPAEGNKPREILARSQEGFQLGAGEGGRHVPVEPTPVRDQHLPESYSEEEQKW